jgi:probable rRNA maturation factor
VIGEGGVEVTIVNRQRARRVSGAALARFGRELAAQVPAGAADRMAVCLVGDAAMARLNRRFRHKHGTTDVLSFPGDGAPAPEPGMHLGDIVISVPRAAEQARNAGHGLARELRLLLLHGYLHLLGYDHETDDGTMERMERRLVRRLVPRKGRG